MAGWRERLTFSWPTGSNPDRPEGERQGGTWAQDTPVTDLAIAAPKLSAPAAAWWSHVQFLAGAQQEGRASGSPGHKRAADYIAAQFRAAQVVREDRKSEWRKRRKLRQELVSAEHSGPRVQELAEFAYQCLFGAR